MLTVGICLFDEVEVLDFAGPFEVFSLAENEQGEKLFNVIVISQNNVIKARNGLTVLADYNLTNHPKIDVLVIPGGYGAEQIEIHNTVLLEWIKQQSNQVSILLSICTGVFLLAKIGLLDNLKATTHWMDVAQIQKDYPKIEVVTNQRYVDNGKIITSGGISSGIHASLYTVAKLSKIAMANETAKRMEFDFYLD
ncbi:DJ-1/PfpI family protein [Moraxella osloensis]|jgi:transcriptional regulator GlxA family with amidase domain|uniref:DJ-1/PfpI family protein n=1 Tax=Faucicola osloensis TaxID=34062 RepID=A0A2I1RHY8_FAUOS|nr:MULTISPECIES: DJ-1/PfpI family protein [Moraxella]PKZ68747.1 DJ-1/PfpI family protein [Moraxella osloensis]WNP27224.1 DJ-1/PfpI family protein [Moraxella sp. DOX410]VWX30196.1 DJ-1/PfpI family protein [Moraxellaceae bacterium 17A]